MSLSTSYNHGNLELKKELQQVFKVKELPRWIPFLYTVYLYTWWEIKAIWKLIHQDYPGPYPAYDTRRGEEFSM